MTAGREEAAQDRSDETAQPVPGAVFRRRLEMGESLPPEALAPGGKNVCRRCGAEEPDDLDRCSACGGVLGGPGQEEFDEAFYARRDKRTAPARPSAPPEALSAEAAAARDDVGFGSILAAGALTSCIFALVSIPVRLAFAAAFQQHLPWRAVSELLVVAVLTLVIRRAFARPLRAL